MTLYLHCGYHKTASSYLQACFASQNALLGRYGIFYPDDPRHADAVRGIPTAGNGAEVAQALLNSQPDRVLRLLARHAFEARRSGLSSVLLSTEGFFSAFAREGGLEMLVRLARDAGFKKLRALIFFRDPVEHAISVYCHRAASGKLPAFEEWLETRFETPALMRAFAGHCERFPITWLLQRFQPGVEKIETVAFLRWLQIPETPDFSNLPAQVNVSISIAESELLRAMNTSYADCGRCISGALKKLPKDQKAEEGTLRLRYEFVAAAYFQGQIDAIDAVNRLLPADQKLVLPQRPRMTAPVPAAVFTVAQSVACAQGLLAYRSSRTWVSRFFRFIRRACLQGKRLVARAAGRGC